MELEHPEHPQQQPPDFFALRYFLQSDFTIKEIVIKRIKHTITVPIMTVIFSLRITGKRVCQGFKVAEGVRAFTHSFADYISIYFLYLSFLNTI